MNYNLVLALANILSLALVIIYFKSCFMFLLVGAKTRHVFTARVLATDSLFYLINTFNEYLCSCLNDFVSFSCQLWVLSSLESCLECYYLIHVNNAFQDITNTNNTRN